MYNIAQLKNSLPIYLTTGHRELKKNKMSYLTERLLNAQYHNYEEDCCCGEECCCHDHEEKEIEQQLSEEEIEKIIEEKYSEKDEKTKEFIRKGLSKWGDRFDYSKTEYVRTKDKVIITCLKNGHGRFEITPDNFLARGRCPKCGEESRARKRSSSTEKFIEDSRKVHGDKYVYEKTKYTGAEVPVIITCSIHGDFKQTPHNHLSGCGCPSCGIEHRTLLKSSSTEKFVEDSRKVHGDKYVYEKTKYINNKTPVIITCSIHGDFLQIPSNHLEGKGCPFCSGKIRLGNEEFKRRAIEVHGYGTYGYDRVNYINIDTPVEIYDPIFDEYFFQTPWCHLLGHGNPTKSMSSGERQVYLWLKERNIAFKREVWLENTFGRHGNKIRVDFLIPLYESKKVIIEYNGGQHYWLVKRYHNTPEEFKAQLARDVELREYCKTNSIYLIEIPYTINTHQSISDFLTKTLIENIDPYTLVEYDSLYKIDDNST